MDPELLKTILPIFVAESREQLQTASSSLMSLDAGPVEKATFEQLGRTFHNIKGAASSVGMEELTTLAHAVEDVLSAVGKVGTVPRELLELLLNAVARMDEVLERLERGQSSGEVPELQSLLGSLSSAAQGQATAPPPPPPAAEPKSQGQLVDELGAAAGQLEDVDAGRAAAACSRMRALGQALENAATSPDLLDLAKDLLGLLADADGSGRLRSRTALVVRGVLQEMAVVVARPATTPPQPVPERAPPGLGLAAIEVQLPGLRTSDASERAQRATKALRELRQWVAQLLEQKVDPGDEASSLLEALEGLATGKGKPGRLVAAAATALLQLKKRFPAASSLGDARQADTPEVTPPFPTVPPRADRTPTTPAPEAAARFTGEQQLRPAEGTRPPFFNQDVRLVDRTPMPSAEGGRRSLADSRPPSFSDPFAALDRTPHPSDQTTAPMAGRTPHPADRTPTPVVGRTPSPAERTPTPVVGRTPHPSDRTPTSPGATPMRRATDVEGTGVDRLVRVSERTLDMLGTQVEELASRAGQEERRAHELKETHGRVAEVLRQTSEQLRRLRALDGTEELRPMEEVVGALRSLSRDLGAMAKQAGQEVEKSRLWTTVVRGELRDLRLMPAGAVLEPLRRAARETAYQLKKEVDFGIDGAEVKLDRRVLETLRDPLMHLVRNAIDHGLDSREQRVAAGKSAVGRVRVRLEQRGPRVVVSVEDDGAGLAVDRIREVAAQRGMDRELLARMSDQEVSRLIFDSGFSTAKKVTTISGRGVGLDVVAETVRRMQGVLDVSFEAGRGTTFTLDVPLSLANNLALLVLAGRERLAIPSRSIERLVPLNMKSLVTLSGQPAIRVQEEYLPVQSLAQSVGLPPGAGVGEETSWGVVFSVGVQRVVFAVDALVGHADLVVHPLGRYLHALRHLAGVSVTDGGKLICVVNPIELVGRARPTVGGDRPDAKVRVLVADDSLTTRTLLKRLLELAGYAVVTAHDGEEALKLLRSVPCSLVVSDVQMPKLDGLGLTQQIRADPVLTSLPVVLVTSLDSAEDRAAGLHVGADGYLVKKEVERGKLVELVRQLIPGREPKTGR